MRDFVQRCTTANGIASPRNDEVAGSIPASSSKDVGFSKSEIPRNRKVSGDFLFAFALPIGS
jgi:hypothetical protein